MTTETLDPAASPLDALPPAPQPRALAFEFRGSGSEYFRIWIVNLLLTVVTVGIYSAWAKVRRLRYFHGNTSLDGHTFDYHAEPVAILIGRLITVGGYALFLLASKINPLLNVIAVPLLLLGLPWVIMRSRRFHLRMTSWRGLRFGFHGDYKAAFKAYIGWWLAAVLTAGILVPVFLQRRLTYLLVNSAYGSQRASYAVGVGRFYAFYGWFVLKALGVLLLMALVAGLAFAMSKSSGAFGAPGIPVAASVATVAAFMLLAGIYQAGVLNLAFGNVVIGPHRVQSTLSGTGLAALLLLNTLLIVITLGLYSPWAKVRLVRYQLAHLQVIAAGDLSEFTAAATVDDSKALGDEISDFFDVDFGL